MPKQITALAPNAHDAASPVRSADARHLGYLTYWTLVEKDWTTDELIAAGKWTDQNGQPAGIPSWMIDRISGRSPRSAWASSTQLGAKGKPSRRVTDIDPAGSTARYLTRDLSETARAIVREINDSHRENVGSETVAIVYFTEQTGAMATQITPAGRAHPALEQEVVSLLAEMRSTMQKIIGKVDDGRVRALLQSWLEREHRVSVRGTGGVYFVPTSSEAAERQRIQDELLAIRKWVVSPTLQGSFSIVDIYSGGATTVDEYVASALDEMKSEMEEISGKLRKWASNPNMNAGSMSYSAMTMVERADVLSDKLRRLMETFGEELAVAEEMLRGVKANALRMMHGAQQEVSAAREAKAASKAEAAGAAEAPDAGTVAEAPAAKPARQRKSGTAAERAKGGKIE